MTLDRTAFDYVKPSNDQTDDMTELRQAFTVLADKIEELLPEGRDKTWIFRQLRTVGMWCNVAITRHDDGAPRG